VITVLDNILPPMVAEGARADFPDESWPWWHRYDTVNARKYGTVDRLRIPRGCAVALDQLADFVSLELSWQNAFIDREWYGGGLHLMPPGGFLKPHLDADRHPLRDWIRRGSVVWFADDCEVGGGLVVSSDDGLNQQIQPVRNQAIVIEHGPDAWHGVTEAVEPRRTLALFLWEQRDDIDPAATTSAKFA